MSKRKIRIFISSPGDVFQERVIAKKVIAELNHTFSKYAEIEALLWEDMPLLSSSSFQEGIDEIINRYSIDIAVFILWSRLGSTLGKNYRKSDGSVYQSGTEYEYDLMMESFKKTGTPKIMVYIKDESLKSRLLSETEDNILSAYEQHMAVKNFISEKFQDEKTGGHYAYFNFGRDVSFESRLRTHLRELVTEFLGSKVDEIKWEGIPYVGLDSYNISQSDIFFGRNKASEDIIGSVLEQLGRGNAPSVIILGESGSGKSSLIQAGVVPILSYVEGVKYEFKKFTPSNLGPQVYDNFIRRFFSFFPQLEGNPVREDLLRGVGQDYDFAYLNYALSGIAVSEQPLIFIDQFEELFTDNTITNSQREQFLTLLKGLVASRRVFIIISMRSDFYQYFNIYDDFGKIKQLASLTYDIPNVGALGYAAIIREPAKLVGVEWEIKPNGESLEEEIINEATRFNSLPLIQFALYEIYKHLGGKNLITYETYKKLGGVRGAFLTYINRVYNNLSADEKRAFFDIISKVITVSNDGRRTFVRKVSILQDCYISDLHKQVVRKLIDAHIFVSGRNSEGIATVTIIHEMLLSSWPVISHWTKSEEYFIKENNLYEQQTQLWLESDDKHSCILKDDDSLMKAEYFHYWWNGRMSAKVKDFIERSFQYNNKLGVVRWSIFTVATIVLLFISAWVNEPIEGQTKWQNAIEWIGSFLILIPLISNVVIYSVKKPTYKTAKLSLIIWSVFLVLMIASDVTDWCINPKGGINVQFIILQYLIIAVATLNAVQTYLTRKKWKVREFTIPFISKIFDAKKYRIFATCVNSLMIIMFIFSLWLTALYADENNKVRVAIACADDMNSVFEIGREEINESIIHTIFANRKIYLTELFSDSTKVDALPNPRKRELARTYYYLAKPDSALLYLENDRSCDAMLLKAHCYYNMGDVQRALEYVKKALELEDLTKIVGSTKYDLTRSYINFNNILSIALIGNDKDLLSKCAASLDGFDMTILEKIHILKFIKACTDIGSDAESVIESYNGYVDWCTNLSLADSSDIAFYELPLEQYVEMNMLDGEQLKTLLEHQFHTQTEYSYDIRRCLENYASDNSVSFEGTWISKLESDGVADCCELEIFPKWLRLSCYTDIANAGDTTRFYTRFVAMPYYFNASNNILCAAHPFIDDKSLLPPGLKYELQIYNASRDTIIGYNKSQGYVEFIRQ